LAAVLVRPEQWRPNLGDIALVRADGSGLRQLTDYRYNADPVLSPDGRRVAYRSVPSSITSLPEPGPRLADDYYNIWVITSDGTQAWQLTNSEAVRSIPTWSLDGQRVAFSQGESGELLEVEVDSGNVRSLGSGIFDPKARPDGNGFGYLTAEGGLAWMDNEGVRQDIVALAGLPAQHQILDFDWRPDGQAALYTLADLSEQVFDSTLGIKYSVWQAAVDGASPIMLAEGVRTPRVSPDGRTAAVLNGSGYGDACVVDQGLAFLALEPGGELVDMTELNGYPQDALIGSFYPLANVTWTSGQQALVEFGLTCDEDRSKAGMYLVDSQARQMVQVWPAGQDAGGSTEGDSPHSGIGVVDAAIAAILSNDINARRDLVGYTTAGCTTVMGLGGPPKCTEGQPSARPCGVANPPPVLA
jgi:dipeptidyl aminopeptidase/acylaminoacyl peptidase